MKRRLLLFTVTLLIACAAGVNAVAQGTWTAPAIPGADISSSNSGNFAIYNVKADAFMAEGMRYGTEAIACRLEGGYTAALAARQKFTLTVADGTVKMVHANHTDRGVGCASANANDIWADYASNNTWTFTASTNYAGAYTLTQSGYGSLDVAAKWGGKLTVTGGMGYTDWAFIPEGTLTDGSFAVWKERKALYDIYAALEASGSVNDYLSAVETANAVYVNSSATAAQLRAAARALFVAAGEGIGEAVNVSMLFTNADLQQEGVADWTSTGVARSGGAIELYHGAITLTQTQTDVPHGLYTLWFRGITRQDGSDAAPVFTATAGDNTTTANVPFMADLKTAWDVASGADWNNGIPDRLWRAAEGLAYEGASAKINNFNVDDDALTLSVTQNSTTQWFAFNSFELEYHGPANLALYKQLKALMETAEPLLSETMNTTAKSNLQAAYTAAEPLDANDTAADLQAAIDALTAANTAASASIAVYTQIGPRLAALTSANQLGDIPAATAQAAEFYTKYTAGTYTSADEVLPLYKAFVADYWTTNTPAANDNLTAYVVNQGFEMGDMTSWTAPASSDTGVRSQSNATYATTGAEGAYLFNTWWQGTPLTQTIANLPDGTYRLTALLASSDGSNDGKLYLTANGTHSNVFSFTTGTKGTFVECSFDFVVSNGNATIGVVGGNDAGEFVEDGHWWYKADNFRLTFLSEDLLIEPEIPEGKMYSEVQTALNTAKEAYEAERSHANYDALLTAIDAAKASIAVYQTMNKYITAQKATAGTTVGWTSIDRKYNAGEYVNATDFVADYQALVATALGNAPAANTDMTPFIINASFEFGDDTSWAHYNGEDTQVHPNSNATYTINPIDGDYLFNLWANNANTKYLFQDITGLPEGTYEVTAVFASDDANSINFTAEGTAGHEEHNSFTTGQAKGVGVEKTVKVYVDDKGTLRFGANTTVWFKVDNFRLTYLGSEIDLPYTLVDAAMNADIRTAQTAAETAYLAEKTNANYLTLAAAIEAAQASADKYVTINTIIPKLEAQKGTVDVTGLTTKYNAGEYVEVDDVFTAYHDIVAAALATPANNTDMTPFIINPSFEFGDNTRWNGGGGVAGQDGKKNIESYNTANFNINQVLTDLPNGTYTLTAQGFYRPGGNNNASTVQNVKIYGNDKSADVKLVATEGKAEADATNGFTTANTNSGSTVYVPNSQNDASLVFADGTNYVNTVTFVVSDGTATIGVRKDTKIDADWALFDNFRLTFVGTELPQEFLDEAEALLAVDTTQPMNAAEKAAYDDARTAWQGGNHSAEIYGQLVAAAPVAEASIAAYERALAAINETFNVLTETNVYTEAGYKALFKTYNDYKKDYDNGLLEDNIAGTIQGAIFGDRTYQQKGVAIVPFLGSAWDDKGDYTWQGVREKNEIWEENYWNYWVNTWSGEGDADGSNFTVPFMEYWTEDDKTLTDRELTATVSAAPVETYTVTGKFRVRVAGGEQPTGIKLVLVSTNNDDEEVEFGPEYTETEETAQLNWHQQPITNSPITWTKVDGTDFWIADYSIKGHTAGTASATDGGALRTLQIKFVFESTNANWFAFKNMMYNPSKTVDANDYYQMMDDMNDAIAYAESHTLGFDYKGDAHGTTIDEYAPWANAENLEDLELLKDYKAVLDPLLAEHYAVVDPVTGEYTINDNEGFMLQAPRYILVNNLIKKVAEAQWIENTNEVNGIYWREDYTADDVDVLQYYLADGSRGGTYYTIFPSGWDLNGRYDAYSTRVIKNNVNTTIFPTDQLENKAGMWAVSGQTVLFVKWDTNYGKETGYTLPLKPNVKYAFQFNYADWGDATAAETNIEIINTRTNNRVNITDLSSSAMDAPDNVNKFTLTGKGQQGDRNESNWYMYRGEFTTEAGRNYTDDYVIYLKKTINERQMQIALGEITLVRAPEDTTEYVINGDTRDEEDDFTPAFDYESERRAIVTRTFNYNGGAGTWNTFVLPFKMDQKETEAMLGEGVELAYYIDCTLEGTYYTLNFERHKAGVLANRPCMVYYDSEKSLNNYVVDYAIVRGNNEKPETLDPQGVLDMVGTYKILDIPADDIYISPDNQWKRSKDNTKLQPTRAYFRNVSGDPEVGAKLMGFRIDDVATGIMAIDDETGDMHVTSGNIYSIDGRLVRQNAKSLEGLQPGIYVVDGKKYYVK